MEQKPKLCTAAYVFDRDGLHFEDRDAVHLNQLNYSFGLVVDGAVSGDHWQHIDAYKAFVSRHPHIRPVVSVGGWGAGGFSEAASTAEGRALFADSAIALMQKHGFLGIDVDWEYPGSSEAGIASSANDRENFTLLLRELRTRLDALTATDGRPRLLGTALGASPSLIADIDCIAVGSIVDQINLMTYDIQTNSVASHHTALYGDERYPKSADHAVKAFTQAGIPKEKIMLGAAFYGKTFLLEEETNESVFAPAQLQLGMNMNYNKLRDWLKDATCCFDEKAKAPYALKGRTFVTYDDAASIGHKGAYAVQHGLMGMMCWEYGGDHSGELLRAMYESLN